MTWLAALGLLPTKARVTGSVRLEGKELVGAARSDLEQVRGKRIAMIFQDPSSCLNPVHRIGRQLVEALGCIAASADAPPRPRRCACSTRSASPTRADACPTIRTFCPAA